MALGTFKNTPFVPHFKRVIELGEGDDRIAAIAGAILSKRMNVDDPKARALLRKHGLA